MIFTNIINGFLILVEWIISLLPSIPSVVNFQDSNFVAFNNYIFDNLGFIDIFVPISLLSVMITGMVSLVIAKWTLAIVLWIFKKIPVLNIK